jgi:3-deoxy-D-manno-octulosonic acid kinase
MSGQKWPLGSEVKRKDLTGGAMLYDASRAGNAPTAAWFDTAYWQERGEIDGEARGRGTTHFIRSGKQNFVLRHYRRGGHVARVVSDRYFWRNESATRSFAEWQLLYHLHRAGLPVPAPVAARYRRHGLTYTADIITERLMDSVSLADQLRRRGIPILGWITIGRCIRSFHDLGVCHPDLNAHNIMLVGDDSVCLIDFDRGRLMKPGLWCDGNLVRLRRSLEKITYGLAPEHFSEADWHGLLDGYRQLGGVPGSPRVPPAGPGGAGTSTHRVLNVAADVAPLPHTAKISDTVPRVGSQSIPTA